MQFSQVERFVLLTMMGLSQKLRNISSQKYANTLVDRKSATVKVFKLKDRFALS